MLFCYNIKSNDATHNLLHNVQFRNKSNGNVVEKVYEYIIQKAMSQRRDIAFYFLYSFCFNLTCCDVTQ